MFFLFSSFSYIWNIHSCDVKDIIIIEQCMNHQVISNKITLRFDHWWSEGWRLKSLADQPRRVNELFLSWTIALERIDPMINRGQMPDPCIYHNYRSPLGRCALRNDPRQIVPESWAVDILYLIHSTPWPLSISPNLCWFPSSQDLSACYCFETGNCLRGNGAD